jgi:DNA-binding transcriptional ArsR family regulator
MIELQFSTEDFTRIRFAFCPVRETVLSVRALSTASPNGLHGPWLQQVRPQLADLDMRLLTALVRPTGYLPDFLFPAPARRQSTFESGLDRVAATAAPAVAGQLSHLVEHRVAQRGPGKQGRVDLLHELIDAPQAGLARIVIELKRYWHVAVAPYWPRVRALLEADLAHRLEELASGGVRQLFQTLHPLVSFHRDTLRVTKYYAGRAHLRQRGLLLIPCVFAWPDVIVGTADPDPTVTYAPRGLGRLWDTPATPRCSPLADLLGRSRAAIVAQLDLPMSTTQLARHLNLTAPTLNVHLKTLQAAGIVSARRDGRMVLYRRTHLGDLLLVGHT